MSHRMEAQEVIEKLEQALLHAKDKDSKEDILASIHRMQGYQIQPEEEEVVDPLSKLSSHNTHTCRICGLTKKFNPGTRYRCVVDEKKVRILTAFEKGISIYSLSQKYKISRATIYRWIQHVHNPKKYCSCGQQEQQQESVQ